MGSKAQAAAKEAEQKRIDALLKQVNKFLREGETILKLAHCNLGFEGAEQLGVILMKYPNQVTYLDVSDWE